MKTVSIREIQHNFKSQIKSLMPGQELIVMNRNKPIAKIIPFPEDYSVGADWSKNFDRIKNLPKLKGKSISETLSESRGIGAPRNVVGIPTARLRPRTNFR
jgi:antitoxin (DNA-binding transcriptional repressor) of toxin-antitoxin stability system